MVRPPTARASAARAVTLLAIAMLARVDAQGPVFRSGVDMVPLTVTVTDASGRYQQGLTETDFTVFEDGVPQALSFFASDRVPVDVALVMDTSGSMGAVLPMLKKAARGLVRSLHPDDGATVVDVKGVVRAPLLRLDDHAGVEAAIERLTASGDTAIYDGVYIALTAFERERRRAPALRRQTLVVFSDGYDTASHVTFEAVRDVARRLDVTIYTIALGFTSGPSARLMLSKQTLEATYMMRVFATDAGGRAFAPTIASELPAVYHAIGEELGNQYQVAYVPSRPAGDGGFRQVAVRISAPARAIARTRIGYLAVSSGEVSGR